jgi:molybdate-binding protein/DNA-binding XRE family transcriptional regulator
MIVAYSGVIMAVENEHDNRVRELRIVRGWSQAELAERAGISRTGVSAIESHRLDPSVTTAIALAKALQCSVEVLFGGDLDLGRLTFQWAWLPASLPCRYWAAEVGRQGWLFPAESDLQATQRHDGVAAEALAMKSPQELADRTLVLAGCDPAAGLLAQEYERQTGFRMVTLVRSSQEAIDLLDQGKVHVAGVHWAESHDPRGNAGVLEDQGLRNDLILLHLADWEEGLAIRRDAQIRSARQAAKTRLQWIGRTSGAGARRCQDQVLGDRKPPAKIARDHRGVVEAIRSGWADVGACVRLASEEARLGFIPMSKHSYDYCIHVSMAEDPRLLALQAVLRSASYRATLLDLPGYDPRRCGDAQIVSANPC